MLVASAGFSQTNQLASEQGSDPTPRPPSQPVSMMPRAANDLNGHFGVVFRVGGRLSFEVGKASWGLAPLYHYNLVTRRSDGTSFFTEIVVPIRFRQDPSRANFATIGLGAALGVLF